MGELILEGRPNPKQEEFFMATTRHIGYGGARGGGKSWAMRRKFVLLALKYQGLNLLILRRTLPELRENHILPLQAELYGHAVFKGSENAFIFPNGSRIKLGYCAVEKDIYQYQGQEYDVIGLEEATHFTEAQKDFLTTCNRSTRTDFKPRMYYTSNPGNVGHTWFKRLFINKQYRNKEKAEDYTFIPAKVFDNTVLMETNPEYVEALENLPEDLRRAHLYGDWDVFAGQYFKEFNRDVHVIEPFIIPNTWDRYFTLDYGLDKCAGYWIAVDTQGNEYIYKELYESDLIISEASKRILEVNGNDKIKYHYGPPDLWNRRNDTGKSAFEIFRDNGLYLYKSKNDRVLGWYELKEHLKVVEKKDEQTGEIKKTAKLKIFNNCINLIRCLPELQCDEKNPNDVANEPHELTHGPDAIRGFCMERQVIKDNNYERRQAEMYEEEEMIHNYIGDSPSMDFINYN